MYLEKKLKWISNLTNEDIIELKGSLKLLFT